LNDCTVELFINDDDNQQTQSVALILKDPGIVEYQEELVPCCALTSWQARRLAKSLVELADELEAA